MLNFPPELPPIPVTPAVRQLQHQQHFQSANTSLPAPSGGFAAAAPGAPYHQTAPRPSTGSAEAAHFAKRQSNKESVVADGPGDALTVDEHDAGDGVDADDPNKRRRVARACDSCRKKKVRCDGIDPPQRDSCTNCTTYGHECTFLNAAKRRAPPRSYVDAIEARMARMESLIASLAPGVDFTDTLGPPVVLPDSGDNAADDSHPAAAIQPSSGGTHAPAHAFATDSAVSSHGAAFANGPVLPPGNSRFGIPGSSSFTTAAAEGKRILALQLNPQQHEDDEEAENIGILLQHHLEDLNLDPCTSNHSPRSTRNAPSNALSASVDTSAAHHEADNGEATKGTATAGTPSSMTGTRITNDQISPSNTDSPGHFNGYAVAPRKTPIQILSTGKARFPLSNEAPKQSMEHGDTAIFFGHSSNFMIFPQLERISLGMKVQNAPQRLRLLDDQCAAPEILVTEMMGPPLESIDLHWPEPDLEAKLVDAYFQNIHPMMPIINEAIFRDELANRPECRQDREWLGLCLGVFSCASRFVDDERLITYPREFEHAGWLLGQQWFSVRKTLGLQMFPPTLHLSQLQGIILSAFFLQATPVGGTMGWALLGIAIRLMQAHGVHRRAVNRARQQPIHIEEQWKRCFWACYNLDVEMSSNMGRPIGLHEDDFDLDFPLEVDDDVLWQAGKSGYRSGNGKSNVAAATPRQRASGATTESTRGDSAAESSSAGASASAQSHVDANSSPSALATDSVTTGSEDASKESTTILDPVTLQGDRPVRFATSFVAMLKLNMIMARILRTIYMLPKARIARGYVGSQAPQFVVAEIDSALNDWINSLPAHIRFDPHEPDDHQLLQAGFVAMRYYNAQILTHRPFISGTRQDNPNFASVAICTNAARSCSHIVDTLRKRGLLRFASMPILGHAFVAGCVLLMVVWSARKSGARLSASTLSDVHKCAEALRAAERSTHPASILATALGDMIAAAEIPFAETSAEQAASHKRARDDSAQNSTVSTTNSTVEVDSTSSNPGLPSSASMGSNDKPTVPSSGSAQRSRRRGVHSGRRSANSSSASLHTPTSGNVSDFRSQGGIGSSAPPLPLSTQELIAPFHSSTSSTTTPEQTTESSPADGSTRHTKLDAQQVPQESLSPSVSQKQPAGTTKSDGNEFRGAFATDTTPHGSLPTSMNCEALAAGMPGGSLVSPTSSNGDQTSSFANLLGQGPVSTGHVNATQGQGFAGPNAAFVRGSAPLNFTDSAYDLMRIAEETADFQLMGNASGWTSSAFSQGSFPAFADVSSMAIAAGSGASRSTNVPPATGGFDVSSEAVAFGMGMGMGSGVTVDMGMGVGGPTGFSGPLPGFMGSVVGANLIGNNASRMSVDARGPGAGADIPSGVHSSSAFPHASMVRVAERLGIHATPSDGSVPEQRHHPCQGLNGEGLDPGEYFRRMEQHVAEGMEAHGQGSQMESNYARIHAHAAALQAQQQQQQSQQQQSQQHNPNTFPPNPAGANGLDPYAMMFSQGFF